MITGINHITFATRDLRKSLAFYRDFLGCQLIAIWQTGAYLQAGQLWLCLSLDKNAPAQPSPAYSHIAFNLEPQNFETIIQKAKTFNVKTWKENTSEGDSLYILDPDFHKLEIHCGNLQSRLEHIQRHPYQEVTLFQGKTHETPD